jgi:hypothetical protein
MSDTGAEITAAGPITWEEGGTANVRYAKDTDVLIRSSVPYPPGKPAKGSLAPTSPDTLSWGFTVKVARSQRVAEGVWDIRGRLLSATNETRRAFEAAAVSAR